MTNLILIVRAILALQALFDQLLSMIVESQKAADRAELQAAIDLARNAKSKEQKIEAAKRITESFRSAK